MRSFASLLLVLAALPVAAQTRAARCFSACERVVRKERLRASACGACLTSPDRPEAWLGKLPQLPDDILADPDWEVRWAALLLEARRERSDVPRRLARWLTRARGDEALRACVTAVHGAGGSKQPLSKLLSVEAVGDGKALASCRAQEPALRRALWPELYAESATVRLEALRHLAVAFERAPAREVLDTLPSHPPAFDALVLDTLAELAFEGERTAVAELLAAATPADVAAMNRLLAVVAERRDAQRPRLASPDAMVRKEAIAALAELAPLSAPELLTALADETGSNRARAARALARGEGRAFSAMARRRLAGEEPATPAQQLTLLELMENVSDPGCAAVALEAWRRAEAPEALRQRALQAAATCRWAEASAAVEAALEGPSAFERAAGVAALGAAPRTEQLTERLARATGAADAPVRAAACEAIAQQRWRPGAARVQPLLADPAPEVRIAAMKALVALDAAGVEARLAAALDHDAVPAVRAAAVALLGGFTSPQALGALDRAARNDLDPGVKLVAAQTLRKLAPGSLSP